MLDLLLFEGDSGSPPYDDPTIFRGSSELKASDFFGRVIWLDSWPCECEKAHSRLI